MKETETKVTLEGDLFMNQERSRVDGMQGRQIKKAGPAGTETFSAQSRRQHKDCEPPPTLQDKPQTRRTGPRHDSSGDRTLRVRDPATHAGGTRTAPDAASGTPLERMWIQPAASTTGLGFRLPGLRVITEEGSRWSNAHLKFGKVQKQLAYV